MSEGCMELLALSLWGLFIGLVSYSFGYEDGRDS